MLTENELYYIAGIVDGEGCFCIKRNLFKNNPNRSPFYIPSFNIRMTDENTIKMMHNYFGGTYTVLTEKNQK